MRRPITLVIALAATLGLASACTNASKGLEQANAGSDPKVSVDTKAAALLPAQTKSAGRIVIASDASYAPFEYFANDNKTMIGFDVELTDALAKVLGVKAQHVNAGFDTILPGLQAGKYDAGASAFGITGERRKVVDFIPYMSMGTGLAVAKGNPEHLSLDDTTSLCGKSISAQKGAIQGITILPKLSKACTKQGKKPIRILLYPSQNEANLALTSGRADGILADSVPLAYEGQQSAGAFELAAGKDYQPAPIGIAVPNGSRLGPALSAAMKVLVDNGTLAKLLRRWHVPAGDLVTSTKLVR
jgi:polar amino acid transport system substrate-binding protein